IIREQNIHQLKNAAMNKLFNSGGYLSELKIKGIKTAASSALFTCERVTVIQSPDITLEIRLKIF
ncbi:TPA_asm: hypothetical protein G0J55_22290, partial [Salmonella enterica subsp. enterica serovar Typhimurium]|nr:hypothetical protein [Salmonella enterica subsp. enterica serovar Typhimurium]EBY7144035.1 hypothetical protein [Salmonella enterica subsp. enterica serovar Typhimurium]HAC9087358.1 hypothetical protein [Salmonella enterica subsp. enterica serovar Typhimurium]HAC9096975.1 hypothetical protein [Salmonella enterica subsp. enterica serovar Typhimurium]HAC9121338.1 hypothetical protein [Salmonella enterica subsp. enterica serovar Typhimurium]